MCQDSSQQSKKNSQNWRSKFENQTSLQKKYEKVLGPDLGFSVSESQEKRKKDSKNQTSKKQKRFFRFVDTELKKLKQNEISLIWKISKDLSSPKNKVKDKYKMFDLNFFILNKNYYKINL